MSNLPTTRDADDETKQLIEAVAINNPASSAELAAILKTTEPLANAFAALHFEAIQLERIRAKMDGRASVAAAQRIVEKALSKINDELDSADGHDASELVKPALRILEANQKERLATRETYDNLPVFNITINGGGGIQVEQVPSDTFEAIEDVTSKVLRGDL